MIVLMAGLPGTGKTTLAQQLALHTGGAVLSKDKLRAALFALSDIEYSAEQDDFCMDLMLQTAEYLFRKEPQRFVFLDGRTFSRGYQIENVIAHASILNQPWWILECVCPEAIARQRIEAQQAAGDHPAGDRDFALYLKVQRRFEPITYAKTIIDTGQPIARSVEMALAALTARLVV